MPLTGRAPPDEPLRIVLVGTGTGVGKTHVACALLTTWSARAAVVGLKPVETGVPCVTSAPEEAEPTGHRGGRAADSPGLAAVRGSMRGAIAGEPSDQERLAAAAGLFHVKRASDGRRRPRASTHPVSPLRSLFAFPEPISPHLAARDAGTRI